MRLELHSVKYTECSVEAACCTSLTNNSHVHLLSNNGGSRQLVSSSSFFRRLANHAGFSVETRTGRVICGARYAKRRHTQYSPSFSIHHRA